MKKFANAGIVVALLTWATVALAQQAPEKEHEWLGQLVGEWEYDSEVVVQPGSAPEKSKGGEIVRAVGGFWTVSETSGSINGAPFTGVMTLGYDPKKKKYAGTWVDSMSSNMLHYEGSVDDSRKTLTLETEGPSFNDPSKISKYKDVIEVKDKDHKVMTSSIQGDDGKWVTFMTIKFERKR